MQGEARGERSRAFFQAFDAEELVAERFVRGGEGGVSEDPR
jgi:hypothetical protein